MFIIEEILKNENLMNTLQQEAINYCITNGIIMMTGKDKYMATHAPFSLLPLPIKKSTFTECTDLAYLMNKLYDLVARDYDFLNEVLQPVASHDPFVAMLLDIMNETLSKNNLKMNQPLSMFWSRSDYMFDEQIVDGEKRVQAKQVEMNMISAAFAGLSTKVTDLHKYIIDRHLIPNAPLEHRESATSAYGYNSEHIFTNEALSGLVAGLTQAHELWVTKYSTSSIDTLNLAYEVKNGMKISTSLLLETTTETTSNPNKPIILMVVQDGERNSADQQHIETALWKEKHIGVVRASLQSIHKYGFVHNNTLYYNNCPVSIVYYRACYTPVDFEFEYGKGIVATMEDTNSIKCPSISHHLAGTKKVQQMLANPQILSRYLSSEEVTRIMKLFVGIHALDSDDETTLSLIEHTRTHASDYVLKPQREGGGNNVWGADIYKTLHGATSEERGVYVLMERIRPNTYQQIFVRNGDIVVGASLSELGVYAMFIGDGVSTYSNHYCGQLLRTKLDGVDEGGVATGYSVLDSFIGY